MSDNKFIKRLKGEQTDKSVLEIKNESAKTSFANMPQGTSNAVDVYSDHRGNATGVLKGTENWKLDGQNLIETTTVYGDGRDFTDSFNVFGNGLWVNATCTFATARRFSPNTKFVLKLCGHDLETVIGNTVDFTLIVKFGTSNLISKTFTVTEQAFNFCKEFVIDFAESNSSTIKADAGSTMQVQLLCANADAQAVIYNGMTVFTALQRRVDGDAVASDKKTFDEVVQDIDDLEEYVDDTFVRLDGSSIMTAPLKFEAGSMRGAVGPYLNGVGFWKLNSQGSLTLVSTLSDSQFIPTTTNAIDLGSSTKKWKDLYLAGKAYVATINNGADITVPTTSGTIALTSDIPGVMTGATAVDAGTSGLVPAPAAGDNSKFLQGDGTWVDIDALPSQTGNSDKLLTTNGTSASWTEIKTINSGSLVGSGNIDVLVNEATPASSLGIGYTTINTTYTDSINIGNGAQVGANNALALGAFASAEGQDSIAIYSSTGTAHRARTTHTGNIAIGYNALAINAAYTIAIGYNAYAQSTNAIQLGTGNNASSNTMQVWTYKLLDKTTGIVPSARLADQTSATQGQVLTLDSNLDAQWTDIDYVVEKQDPTAGNNYTWYRKYKSGWVEQGGKTTNFTNTAAFSGDDKTVTFPIVMSDAKYSVSATMCSDLSLGNGSISGFAERVVKPAGMTTTGMMVAQWANAAASGTSCYAEWQVSGIAA